MLSAAIAGMAPRQPVLPDRSNYEYNFQHWLWAYCPNSIFCYRILVPVLLEFVPMDTEPRWRRYQWLVQTAAGAVVATAVTPFASPFITSTMVQSSYAFSYTAYDPFVADP